jgi:hypothetical protein
MTEQQVFGDSRDIRHALEQADPEFMARPEEVRRETWGLLERFLAHYAPLKTKCGCNSMLSWGEAHEWVEPRPAC